MHLSDKTIKELISNEKLIIDPFEEDNLQAASLDCRLDSNFLVVDDKEMEVIEMDEEISYREIEKDSITIPSQSFILATTREYFGLPSNITAFVEGRSSIGRMGLFVQNAGWIDPGFEGNITLELYNANSLPIKLKAGRRVCQIVFSRMDQSAQNPYQGKYQGQKKTTGSKIFEDKDS